MTIKLLDKVSIVTGSGRGIGARTALELAQAGSHIVINDIQSELANKAAVEIEKLGRKVFISNHDISKTQEAHKLVEEVKSFFGKIDILINNAGITRDALLHKLTEENWDEVIRVNLKGTFNMGQAVAKVMMEQKQGKIVNLASVAWLGNIGQTNYAASKAGVVGLTRTWALELSKYGIQVNCIAPGFIDTVLTSQIPQEIKDKFIQRIPLKRIGRPEDIAQLIAFLVSDQATYITGQCIHVDGGLSCGISF
ncbi:MAG: 3-oxoacyl-[acyl-carrier-protein] reductase [Deltaproteobacteria bacterium]|nr:3-oxoacyl-[acyl-carrier-protein] reductase [Deltaproteobacteria bacterium]